MAKKQNRTKYKPTIINQKKTTNWKKNVHLSQWLSLKWKKKKENTKKPLLNTEGGGKDPKHSKKKKMCKTKNSHRRKKSK